MKISNTIKVVSLAVLILSSCVSRKHMTYLNYSDKSAEPDRSGVDIKASVTPAAYKVMTYDNLYIRVLTPDPQWSALFNMDVGSGSLTQESAALSGYNVDSNGNIEIPYVGKLVVAGKTLSEIKAELDSVFRNYVTDAAITVKLVNNSVSILGEVRSPGRYTLTKDRLNIFEALSMAGDINEYGNRQKVQLIRQSPFGPEIKEFSLSDRSIMSSEYYYILPNDIIYCSPMKARSFQINSSPLTLALSAISTVLVIVGFVRTF